jgi:chromosome segregation ATPase
MAFPREDNVTKDAIGDYEITFTVLVSEPDTGRIEVQIITSSGQQLTREYDLVARLQDDAAGLTHLANLIALRDYLDIRQQLFTDLGQSYGLLIGQLTLNKLGLERQAQRLQTEVAMLKAEITQLNQERANFISAHVNLEEQISALQAENESLRKKLYQMETDLLKAQGKAIINEVQVTDGADVKEKAAT